MQRVIEANKKSEKLLKKMKRDLEKLDNLNSKTHKNFENLNETIEEIQEKLHELQSISKEEESKDETKSNKVLEDEDTEVSQSEDYMFLKRIIITRRKSSNSFKQWFFNNLEL